MTESAPIDPTSLSNIASAPNTFRRKPAFTQPRLTFMEPKLTPSGDLRGVMAEPGFFSPSFNPLTPS